MNRHAIQLISRGAVNKIGNILYDYGNSVWLASMGTIGQTVLGMYQISELVTSILVNPFGGVISDRFSRRKILMAADLVCGILCLAISFIRNDSWMIGALIFANIVQAIAFAFSRPANKAIITELVEKDELVLYNSRLELVLQVVSVSSPVLSFLVLQFASLHLTLLLDALTFFIAFALVALLPQKEIQVHEKKSFSWKDIFVDMQETNEGSQPERITEVEISAVRTILHKPEHHRHDQPRILCHDGTPSYPRNAHPQTENESDTEHDVGYVREDGDVHRRACVLHPDVPALNGEEKNRRRHSPDTRENIFGSQRLHFVAALHERQRILPYRLLEDEDQRRKD